ncbi:MAG TPA: AAA family ATPase [Candidatus Margulisiibacteriota bacterium]|nr:AAA family ATPase [Candidatus Margulisiibacteriota bacterium]
MASGDSSDVARFEDQASDPGPESIGFDHVTGTAPFVGRARELAALHAALADAVSGLARLVLLAGEPGIGKTRTAEQVAGHARARGMQVLWGRCYEGEGAPAFWPWVQILRTAIRHLEDDVLRAALGWGGAELAHIVPELRQRLPDLGATAALDSAQARFRLFEGVARFLENLSQRAPLVCLIDDLHGGDRPSLLLLEFVARDLRDAGVLLLGSYRHGATLIGHPLTELVVEALRLPGAERLTLSGLSVPEVAELVERMTGVRPPAATVAAVYQQTEGNPLYVGEYVRLLLARHAASALSDPQALRTLPVPDGVRAVVRHRVAPLSSVCRAVLSVAAVVGREFHRDVVEAVVASDPEADGEISVLAALDEAAAAGIVAEALERGGRYRFAHAVMREALYEELGSGQRLQLHRRVGEALEQRRDTEDHLAELAYHFYQAAVGTAPARAEADTSKTVAYARRAGARAMAALAYEEAVRLYQLALLARDHWSMEDDAERQALLAALDTARAASRGASTSLVGAGPPDTAAPAPPAAPLAAADDAAGSVDRRAPRSGVLRREGDYWTIGFDGRTVRVKHSKGLQYLVHLLRHPGQQFVALDLLNATTGVGEQMSGTSKPIAASRIPEPILDAKARAAYKRRLEELRDALGEAERNNDIGRSERARAEMEALAQQLAAATGLTGERRLGSDAAERARSAVGKRVRAEIRRVGMLHPPLGRHLALTVTTGNFCAYEPEQDVVVVWKYD